MSPFRALRVSSEGEPARVHLLKLDDLSPGDVTVRVHYSSLNYKDALAVTGRGKILRQLPLNPGIDAAGVVISSGYAHFRPGDRVLVTGCGHGEQVDGGFAEVLRVRGSNLIALPDGLSLREAMILGTAGFTAALALDRLTHNGQAPTMGAILITGASGGVGSFATQIFAQAGYEVHAVSGKTERAEYLRGLGARTVITPEDLALGQRPLESVRWGGAVDNVGGQTLARLLAHIEPWGNVAAVGLTGGAEVGTTVMPFILRGISVLGISSTNAPLRTRLQIWQRLAGPWKPHQIESLITRTIGLDQIADAAEDMLARRTFGRILVDHRDGEDRPTGSVPS